MKKKLNYKILIFIAILIIAFLIICFIPKWINTLNFKQKETSHYRYIISGAVLNKGVFYFNKPQSYQELFFKTGITENSNIDNFDLKKFAPQNTEIYVPFRNYKLRWSDIKSIADLQIADISKKYATMIFNYRLKHEIVSSWNEILQIPGIGLRTIEKLKSFLILG
ncbi:MAG0490 family ComEA-like DNA-binding protein [Mycoplasmopsis gallinacea]|uniref:Uncharacterized protein n=1 Tax=Mycoplasmopsis gallinacea TaxID=29556 RepID=A0A6H0V2M5_9BACT|nr:helix-hairpin-helix domain-containing protein [Mycoplasmopsis gallinacea]QIW62442.1 hypothetical protein GOQ20_03400 [Mycoplasmopsis gallinacea]